MGFRRIITKETSVLDKARIKIFVNVLFTYTILFTILLILYIFQERNFLLIRASIMLPFFITLLWLLSAGYSWRMLSHSLIIGLSILNWTNVLFFNPGVNLTTIQYALLIVTCTYYILGAKSGLIYSLIKLLPILLLTILKQYDSNYVLIFDQSPNGNAFNIVLSFNFGLFVFINYFFFKEFQFSMSRDQEQQRALTNALSLAKDNASQKTNFLSTMSHELRTPLNAVVGMANILSMENPKPEQAENLKILQFSAENLMCIINDILDFNKIDAEKVALKITDFRMDILVDNVYGTFKAAAREKGLEYIQNASPKVKNLVIAGDHARLTQILFNILGNSLKFTHKGSIIFTVDIKYKLNDIVRIFFGISDTGIGISSEQQKTIFEPFIQSTDRTNRQFHGTGLGLTIASKLVELHGGKLLIESQEEKGTTISFEIDCKVINNVKQISSVSDKNNIRPKSRQIKILVAEDNPVNVLVIKKTLTQWNMFPDIVENGKEAVEAVISGNYDVILMDINMPVMDGFEASRKIRELPDKQKSSIHIIALTASVGASIESHHGYQYLNDCVLKPFRPEVLKGKLDHLIQSKRY